MVNQRFFSEKVGGNDTNQMVGIPCATLKTLPKISSRERFYFWICWCMIFISWKSHPSYPFEHVEWGVDKIIIQVMDLNCHISLPEGISYLAGS